MNTTIFPVMVGPIDALGVSGHRSAIAKHAVAGPVMLGPEGFTGDAQADRRHHGGTEKAVHHYAYDHYAWWQGEIGAREVLSRPGAFGENIASLGLTEENVCIGDVFRLGSALVQVSQARQPCWKLNVRFDCPDMARMVQTSRKTGWYYRVLEQGIVSPNDALQLVERPHPTWPVGQVLRILYLKTMDQAALEELACLDALTESWRMLFRRRLESCSVEDWSRRLNG